MINLVDTLFENVGKLDYPRHDELFQNQATSPFCCLYIENSFWREEAV
jgi:hypothetical protein